MRNAMQKFILLAALFCVGGGALFSANAYAAEQCRDDKGKFIKCPPPAAAPVTKCRDMKTKKFAKCSAPGTEPVPEKTPPKAN